jgi:hypothetical protein
MHSLPRVSVHTSAEGRGHARLWATTNGTSLLRGSIKSMNMRGRRWPRLPHFAPAGRASSRHSNMANLQQPEMPRGTVTLLPQCEHVGRQPSINLLAIDTDIVTVRWVPDEVGSRAAAHTSSNVGSWLGLGLTCISSMPLGRNVLEAEMCSKLMAS